MRAATAAVWREARHWWLTALVLAQILIAGLVMLDLARTPPPRETDYHRTKAGLLEFRSGVFEAFTVERQSSGLFVVQISEPAAVRVQLLDGGTCE